MSFDGLFTEPFYSGKAIASEVPELYDVGIGGHPYLVDWVLANQNAYLETSIEYIRRYSFYTGALGEQTLNPDPAWREPVEDWSAGAGQIHFDDTASIGNRFRSSKGIDVWSTKGQFSLLPDTAQKFASANTNLAMAVAGGFKYQADGNEVYWTSNGTSRTAASINVAEGAQAVQSIASDGFTVYAALGVNGLHKTTRGASVSTHMGDNPSGLTYSLVGYVKGRLMTAASNSIYNVVTGKVLVPTTLAVVTQGSAGATTYGYRVAARNAAGTTLACAEVTIATGNAALTTSNFNKLTWDAMAGAASYDVYGRTAGAELFMANVAVATFNDTGTISPAGALPAADTTGTAPTALLTHPNTDFTWVGFAEGANCLYAAGFSGDKSQIFLAPLKTDGSGLSAPLVAGVLPTGEIVRCIYNYLGFINIGTDKGVRVATADANGYLTIGALIQTPNPVRCFEGQGSFVYFGWENYDTTSTGIGRIDFRTINDAPAYASDLMVTAQGAVSGVATFAGLRWIAVQGQGFYQQSANLVPTGSIDSGLMTMKLQDTKVLLWVDTRTLLTAGSHDVWLAINGGAFTKLGTHTATSLAKQFPANNARGEWFEVRHVFNRDGTDPTKGPTMYHWATFAVIAPPPGITFEVPIRLETQDSLPLRAGKRLRNPTDELQFLRNLRADQTPIVYQEGTVAITATVSSVKMIKQQRSEDRAHLVGTCIVTLKTFATPTGV